MKRHAFLLAIASTIVCAPARRDRPAVPQPPAKQAAPRDPVDVANDVAMLATGAPATKADLDALAAGSFKRDAFSRYIAELVKRPATANVAMSVMRITGGAERNVVALPILKEQDGIYYLHEPCAATAAVTVKPWWALDTTVRVCPAAYRPDVFRTPEGNYCSGVYASPREPKSPCGCGPNLIRCVRSEADKDAFKQAIMREAKGTLAYVIEHDLPLSTLFTSVESFRPPLAELLYQRWRVENRDVPGLEALPDWRTWPADGQWAARPASKPNEHAGIFTNHFTPQMADSQRMKVSNYFEILWCQSGDSLRVKTSTVLDIAEKSGANLRGTVKVGPNELAARPLCTECHARIDYGVQFFAGIQWHYKALHYVAEAQSDADGEMYHHDIQDLRGHAARNPQGFVQLALAQPEYPACMARNFLMHAFATATDPALEPLAADLRGVVEHQGTYRQLLERTLESYVARALSPSDVFVAPHATTAQRAKQVAEMIANRCDDCHDANDGHPPAMMLRYGSAWCDKAGSDCERIGTEIMNAVAFERMPKDAPFSAADKRGLFELLAPIVWRDERARESARRYYVDYTLAPPVHRLDAMTSWVRNAAESKMPLDIPPVSPELKFSVSSAAELAIAAEKLCAAQKDVHACLAKAMQVNAFEK